MTGSCRSCNGSHTAPTMQTVSDLLWRCYQETRYDGATIHQLAQVTFREQALTAIRSLACTGKPFTIGECHELVTVKPVNPQTEWPAVTREAVALGWIVEHGFTTSVVATTKGSAVRQWIGTYAAQRAAS